MNSSGILLSYAYGKMEWDIGSYREITPMFSIIPLKIDYKSTSTIAFTKYIKQWAYNKIKLKGSNLSLLMC
jgi:hypothetical protein